MTATIAVLAPDVTTSGGLRTVFDAFVSAIDSSSEFDVLPISMATSRSDRASRRMLAPGTWLHGPQVLRESDEHRSWQHVGCSLAEVEWLRFAPHSALTSLIREADVVQVIGGTPAWALTGTRTHKPLCLQVATTIVEERGPAVGAVGIRQWRSLMTAGSRRLDQFALRRVDHVMVENSAMEQLASSVLPGQVSLIYPGTDIHRFCPAASYAANGPLLAVGRLGERRKDWPLLLTAYARARQILPKIPSLVLAGRGALSASDHALIEELGLGDSCQIVSTPSRDELAALYRTASIFVLSSKEEGLGLVVVEAMASGIPVVATTLAGTRESVVDGVTGILVERNEETIMSMAHALVGLYEHGRQREAMGLAARARAVAMFSQETFVDHVLDIYRKLLANGD